MLLFIFRFPRNQKPRHHTVITCVLHAHAKLFDFQIVMEILLQNMGMLVTKHLHTPPWSKFALLHFAPEVDATVLNQPNNTKPKTSQAAPRKKNKQNQKPRVVLRHDSFVKAILQRAMSPSTCVGTLLDLCCH